MKTVLVLVLAAFAEIAGCFAFWAHFRLDRSAFWLAPGLLALTFFAFLLTRMPADFAGRAYAAYGGIYIVASLVWMWVIERQQPDAWDIGGAMVALGGAAIILLGRHG